ncbi:MAG: CoA transferase [Proteobacteria bacterium]|nr:CoA transferase [Pseudomonadota bacterium]
MSASGIFAGVRILEFGSGAAGPVATRYFAEQGARVIRVESAKRPDFLRLLHGPDPDAAPMFALLNPDKESVALNLAEPAAREIAERLVDWADVVAENFSPGVMARLGLDPERLRETRPQLITVSGCLFGQTGPQRAYPGFGGQGAAIAGFNHLTGWPDREAVGPYATITDSLSPRYVALAVAAALLERRRTGLGRAIDLSQIETGVFSLSEMIVRQSAGAPEAMRRGNHCEYAAPHAVYPCRGDDRWIAIAVFDDAQWLALRGVLDECEGGDDWGGDERFSTVAGRLAHEDEIDGRIADRTRDRDPRELMHSLQSAGVEAGVVQNFDDVLNDPQLAHRDHFQKLTHPRLGELSFERSALRFSENPGSVARPGPLLGEHTRVVLKEILGASPEQIDRWIRDEVLV